jgi:uncharacterized membrane protein YkvA (DUF1232 family)
VPWYARLFAVAVAAYAFSPVDLIPDFIPILGYLDDLVLIPLGVVLALKMIPPDVLLECRQEARQIMSQDKPVNRTAAVVIIAIWAILITMLALFAVSRLKF